MVKVLKLIDKIFGSTYKKANILRFDDNGYFFYTANVIGIKKYTRGGDETDYITFDVKIYEGSELSKLFIDNYRSYGIVDGQYEIHKNFYNFVKSVEDDIEKTIGGMGIPYEVIVDRIEFV